MFLVKVHLGGLHIPFKHFFWVGYGKSDREYFLLWAISIILGAKTFLKPSTQESSWILRNLTGNTSYECIVQVASQKYASLSFHHPIAPGDFFEMYILVPLPIAHCPGPEPVWLELAQSDL